MLQATSTAEDRKEGDVQSALNLTENYLNDLHHSLDRLIDRLQPVISNVVDASMGKGNGPQRVGDCELSKRILSDGYQVEQIVNRINSLVNHLEI